MEKELLTREAFLDDVLKWVDDQFHPSVFVDESTFPNPVIHVPDKGLALHLIPLSMTDGSPDKFISMSADFADKHMTLVHLWEDIWRAKPEIVKSRLESLMNINKRIHARETKVNRINQPDADKFLEQNHLIGTAKSKFKYGLFKRGELVAIATFGPPLKLSREGEPFVSYEMIRYCNKSGYTVVGGLSKLIKACVREHSPDDIVTYADRDWSRGRGFKRLKFELLDTTPAQYFYVDPTSFERHWAHRPPFEIEEDSTRENIKWEYLQRGYYEVFNTGNWKFIRYYK